MQKCDHCGKSGAKINLVTHCYGKDADLLVIEDIPVIGDGLLV